MSDLDLPAEEGAGPAPVRPGLRTAFGAMRYRNFALFWVGALLSNTGSWIQLIAVPAVVYDLTQSAVALSLISSLQFAPIVLMGPIGGSLADRFERRKLLVAGQIGQAVVAIALWLTWVSGAASVPAIVGLVVVSSFINGLIIPAWQAFVSDLVPRRALLNAVTLNSTQFNASRAFGPAIGGVVLTAFGAGAAFLLNGISFAAVIAALLLIRLPGREPRPAHEPVPVWRAFVDSLRYSRARPGILACFLVVSALGGFGSPFVQLLPAFARDVFVVNETGYGFLSAGLGVGSILVMPSLAGRGSLVLRSRMVEIGMLAYGASMFLFAASGQFVLGVIGLLIGGGGYLALASTLNTTIQLQVDEAMRGKVLAVYVMLLTLSLPLGLLMQAALLRIVGLRWSVLVFAVGFLGVYVWMRLSTDYFAHLDDERAEPAAPAPEPVIDLDDESPRRVM